MQQIRSDKRSGACHSETQLDESNTVLEHWHPLHPFCAFHREVLTVQHWTRVRRNFLQALEKASAGNSCLGVTTTNNNNNNNNDTEAVNEQVKLCWNEPRKLWRHSQEVLGKWILSQIARVPKEVIEPLLKEHKQIVSQWNCNNHSNNNCYYSCCCEEEEQECQQEQNNNNSRNHKSSSNRIERKCNLASSFSTSSTTPTTTTTSESIFSYESALGMFFFLHESVLQCLPNHTTYDEQLIRDLSLKSNASFNETARQILIHTITSFDLKTRCKEVYESVELAMKEITVANRCKPVLRKVDGNDHQRTIAQQRIAGEIAEFTVSFPTSWPPYLKRDCSGVSIPWAAYERLVRCYTAFTQDSDVHYCTSLQDSNNNDNLGKQVPHVVILSEEEEEESQELMLYRIATVVFRYESNLATGSLQLCADNSLKNYLHKSGYVVMDLCASPINAYMPLANTCEQQEQSQLHGKPECSLSDSKEPHSLVPCESSDGIISKCEVPHFFCSAFADTDVYFGSLGSALHIRPETLYYHKQLNPHQRPLLLTLDVPYDEDLCELLFQKLVQDMKRVGNHHLAHDEVAVDYVLVLPLWWNIPLPTRKRLFLSNHPCQESHTCNANNGKGNTISNNNNRNNKEEEEEEEMILEQLIAEKSATLHEGYVIQYTWPYELANAVQVAKTPSLPSSPLVSSCTISTAALKDDDKVNFSHDAHNTAEVKSWVCFDGVFVGESYTYFSTTTNKKVSGVTTTEVIALGQPHSDGISSGNDNNNNDDNNNDDDSNNNNNNNNNNEHNEHFLARAMNSFYGVK